MTRSRRARALVIATAASLSLTLIGCSEPEPMPTPTESITASASPTAVPDPEPVFDGTADENQPYFDLINRELIASGATLNGAAFVGNLVDHGYPRADMEVTPDRTAIGEQADNIVFSIRFGDSCLLGQWGNVRYSSLVTEVLSTGRCIVGTARPA